MASKKYYGLLCLKGMAMGAADVVPGVSGGTIAFIVGIYDELLLTIRSITPKTIMLLFKQGPKAFWAAINGNFLVSLLSGIAISILSLARAVTYLLENHPVLIWSFFFGLIVASIVYLAKQINTWNLEELIAIIFGTFIAYCISITPPTEAPQELWFVFVSGAIAICAMILPGISGSFILLLLGMYSFILNAVTEFDLVVISVFASGCIIGLLAFSHLLSWLLKKYRSITMTLLTGFLLGSLNVVWPWKYVTESVTNRHGQEIAVSYQRVLPQDYQMIAQDDPHILAPVTLMLIGFVLVLALDRWAAAMGLAEASE